MSNRLCARSVLIPQSVGSRPCTLNSQRIKAVVSPTGTLEEGRMIDGDHSSGDQELAVVGVSNSKSAGDVWRFGLILICFVIGLFNPLVGWLEATEYFVAVDHPNASDSNSGLSLAEPFRTLSRAVQALYPGDVLNIKEGIYREPLIPVRSGTSNNQIVIRAWPGDEGAAIIRGSDVTVGWSHDGGDNWSVPFVPLPLINYPSGWPDVTQYSRRREMVFLEGEPLRQVMSATDLVSGSFWMDDGSGRLRINVPVDPNQSLVEISKRSQGVLATGSHQVFRGLRVDHVSTELWIAAMHLGPDQTVENCTVEHNNGYGVVAYSNLIFSNSRSNHNGRLGIALNGSHSLLDTSETSYNSWRYGPRFDAGGIKITGAMPVDNRFVRHRAIGNNGIGIWFDTTSSGNIVEASYFDGNVFGAIEFEAVIGPNFAINNVIVGTVKAEPGGINAIDGAGIIVFDSSDVTIYNNTIVDVAGPGISIAGDSRNSGGTIFHVDDTLAVNNIIVGSGRSALSLEWLWGTAVQDPRVGSHHFDNNLYFDNAVTVIFPDVPNVYGYMYWSLPEWQANRSEDLDSIASDPMFVRPNMHDYSLMADSAAIDGGQHLNEVGQDIAGELRPQGVAFDVGAYECSAIFGCGSVFVDDFETGDLSNWQSFY